MKVQFAHNTQGFLGQPGRLQSRKTALNLAPCPLLTFPNDGESRQGEGFRVRAAL